MALTIRVLPEVFQALEQYAAERGVTISAGTAEVLEGALGGSGRYEPPADSETRGYDAGIRRGMARARLLIQAAVANEWTE